MISRGYSDNAIGQVITFIVILLEEENTGDLIRGVEMEKNSFVSFSGEMWVSNQLKGKVVKQSPEKNYLVHFRLHSSFLV